MIRPFCIMLLYRYLLHYGLLLHIMSQYLCLFSLILQGLHEEGECRQLDSGLEKEQNIRDLFCTTLKVLKLHESQFWNILKILGEESTRGGHPLSTRVEGAPYPLGAPPASWATWKPPCRCQTRRNSGRGSLTVHLRRMVTGGKTLRPA